MKRLSMAQVKAIHGMLIIEIGGTAGVRDESVLETDLISPLQTFDGDDIYKGLAAKAARLGYGIIHSRPFIGGNVRTGMHTMLTFLAVNNVWLHCSDQEIVDAGHLIASEEMSQGQLMHWIIQHS